MEVAGRTPPGRVCPRRGLEMRGRKEPVDYRTMAELRNAVWLGPVVPNTGMHTWWKCRACGRRWRTTYASLLSGSACPDCSLRLMGESQRRRPEDYHARAAERGIRWVGNYPESANHRTEWECAKGHRWSTDYVHIRAGTGCPDCARQAHLERCAAVRHDEAAYRAAGERAGLDWLGPLPANVTKETRWRCRQCGGLWVGRYNKLPRLPGCPRCSRARTVERRRRSAACYRALARKRGFTWLGPRPRLTTDHTRWRCPDGHEWDATYACIARGSGCHTCGELVSGKPVSKVQRMLAERLGGELNHRVGLRCIDVALEREGVPIAVEYDSWFYHGHPLVQTYDAARAEALIALGWRVLQIRGAYTLPSQDELDAALAWLVAGEERVVITIPEWGVGPFRDAKFDPERMPRPYRRRHGGPRA